MGQELGHNGDCWSLLHDVWGLHWEDSKQLGLTWMAEGWNHLENREKPLTCLVSGLLIRMPTTDLSVFLGHHTAWKSQSCGIFYITVLGPQSTRPNEQDKSSMTFYDPALEIIWQHVGRCSKQLHAHRNSVQVTWHSPPHWEAFRRISAMFWSPAPVCSSSLHPFLAQCLGYSECSLNVC